MIKIDKYLYILLGFLLTLYILYIRIFLVRLPKELLIKSNDILYFYKILLIIIPVIVCAAVIVNNILIELQYSQNTNKFKQVITFILGIIENSYKHLYSFLMSFIENKYDIISNISYYFYKYAHKYSEYSLLFITYIIRLIIVLIFTYEVFFKFKLDLFYKSLGLLCINLIINLFVFVLKDFATNVDALKEALIIEDLGINQETQLPVTNYSLKPEYEDNDLQYVIQQFILCNKLTGYLDYHNRYVHFFSSKFNIIVYTLYLIGWSYILFQNLVV